MEKTIPEKQEELRRIFAAFQSPDEKWKYLLQLAKDHPKMDPQKKEKKFLVSGCAAQMYLIPRYEGGKLYFEMDVDAGPDGTLPLISFGLGALALQIYQGASPSEILAADPHFFQEIGLNVGLSPTRANGFASLLRQIYLYAKVYAAMEKR
ncbi:MAG: SufE family protein [Fibrobacter sp.]|jgi:cysteine desulfuration protein SufE|nr:SufE family protein [Fibrobacter sp.]